MFPNLHFGRNAFIRLSFFLFFIILNWANEVLAQSEKQLLKQAEAYFDSSNYQAALPLYLQLHEKDSSNSIYNYAIGLCYYNASKEKIRAIPYFEKVARDKKSPFYNYVFLNLGQVYALDYRFNDAKAALEKYQRTLKKSDPEYQEISQQIPLLKAAQDLVDHPVKFPIKNMGDRINSAYPEYSPILSADERTIIFTAKRPDGASGREKDDNGQFFEDVFCSTMQDNGKWSEAAPISSKINTLRHDASVGLSADGQQLLLYKDDNGDGNIYSSTLNGFEWSTPEKLNDNINSTAYEPSACLSPDGNTLYFVSDRKGGLGMTDIYKSKKLPDGTWGLAVNLGPTINTDKEEDSPFIQADEKGLYFSSKGRTTLGGYDILFSALGADGSWSTPVNVGYPINTTDDDLFYVVSANGKHAYYASAKQGGYGDKDIYQVMLPSSISIALIKGKIFIDDRDSIDVHSTIEVTKKSNGELLGIYKPNSKTGRYLLIMNPEKEYIINIKTEGFAPYSKSMLIPTIEEYTEFHQEIHYYNKTKKKPEDMVFYDHVTSKQERDKRGLSNHLKDTLNPDVKNLPVLANIPDLTNIPSAITGKKEVFFDSDQRTPDQEGQQILNATYVFMKNNPSNNLQIEGHTDSRGTASYNLKLSADRASACKDYLVTKGINKNRINTKVYGEIAPIATNKTASGRQKNRRVQLLF